MSLYDVSYILTCIFSIVIVTNCCNYILQWSPTEPDVFASCSVDKTIAIWDIRKGKKPCIQIQAHNSDVNVVSWNQYVHWKILILFMSMIASAA
jgi:WD40 repeat protein